MNDRRFENTVADHRRCPGGSAAYPRADSIAATATAAAATAAAATTAATTASASTSTTAATTAASTTYWNAWDRHPCCFDALRG